MWKKIKIICITIAIGAVAVLSIIFGSRSNRRGVSGTDQLNRDIESGIDNIQDGIEGAQGAIDGVSSDLGQGVQKIDSLDTRLGNTQGKLQSALEILQRAKARTNSD